jgi:hypothetical protein
MPGDAMTIEILEDGTVKVTTEKVSDVNHLSADNLLKHLEKILGGDTTSEKRPDAHAHAHHHHHHEHEHKKAW